MFSAVRWLSGLDIMFALPDSFLTVPRLFDPVFVFTEVARAGFGCPEGDGSRYHVLHVGASFRLYRGRRVPSSCFALPDYFSAVPSALGPVFMFCTTGLVFGSAEDVLSRRHVFRSRTCFWRGGGRRISFSCFALPNTFSSNIFLFCVPRLVFCGTEGVGSRFHVLRVQTYFRRYRGHRVLFSCLRSKARFRRYGGRRDPFSCFALQD
jgi:hypothetical protein